MFPFYLGSAFGNREWAPWLAGCPNEPQCPSLHQPQPSHQVGSEATHIDIPGQDPLQLHLSCRRDTGTKHPGTSRLVPTSALGNLPGHPPFRVPLDIPANTFFSSRSPVRDPHVKNILRPPGLHQPQLIHLPGNSCA